MTERWEVELEFVVTRDGIDNADGAWDTMLGEFHDLAVKHGMDFGGMSMSARKIQPKRQEKEIHNG